MATPGRSAQFFIGLVRRHFQDSVKGTVVGQALLYLQSSVIIVFLSVLLNHGFRGTFSPTEVFVITVALANWLYFSGSVSASLGSFRTYRYALYNRHLSRFLVPLVPVVGNLPILVFNLAICLVIYFLQNARSSFDTWFLMLAIFANVATCSFLAILAGYASAFLQDFRFIVAAILQLCFWMSPIVWSSEGLGETARTVLTINPFFAVAESIRLAGSGLPPRLPGLAAMGVHCLVWAALAWFAHARLKRVLGEQL